VAKPLSFTINTSNRFSVLENINTICCLEATLNSTCNPKNYPSNISHKNIFNDTIKSSEKPSQQKSNKIKSLLKEDINEDLNADNNIYKFINKGKQIVSHNIQHILPKLDEIKANFSLLNMKEKPDIFGLSETCLNPINCKDKSHELKLNDYDYPSRKDRIRIGGGGLLVYFKSGIKYERKNNIVSSSVESMWFEILPKHEKSFLICFVYRPPDSPSIWYKNFEKEIINASIMNKEIIFLGDLNIDYLKHVPTSWATILTTHGFFQMITEPTRVTTTSVTLIDHIYTTNPENFIDIKVPCYAISDHYPICCTKKSKSCQNNKTQRHKTISYRNFKHFDDNKFLEDLCKQPFDNIGNINDTSKALETWYSLFLEILNKHAPEVQRRIKKQKQPDWLNDEICQSRKQRDYYAKISNFSKYKEYRNKTTSLTRKSKTRLFKNAIEKDKNIKYLWNHLKDLNSNSTSNQIKEISDEGKTLIDLSDICNYLNKHFTSIANKVITFPSTDYQSETLGSFVKNKVPDTEKFCIKTTNENEVFKLLYSLDPSKSIGPDGIGPKILKIAAPIVTKSLAYILNQSILSG